MHIILLIDVVKIEKSLIQDTLITFFLLMDLPAKQVSAT